MPPATGSFDVTIQVADEHDGTDEQRFVIVVTAGEANVVPEITSVPLTDAVVGVLYEYRVIGADRNGDSLTFELVEEPSGMEINPQTGVISWTPSADQPDLTPVDDARFDIVGLASVKVQASDGRGGTVTQLYDILVRLVDNLPPTIISVPPGEAVFGELNRYEASAFDPDVDDILTWELINQPAELPPGVANAQGVPRGMTINPATGVIVWIPTITEVGLAIEGTFGIQEVLLGVKDGNGGFDAQRFPIVVQRANTPPVITSTPPNNATVNVPFAYQVVAHDPDINSADDADADGSGDLITFRLDSSAPGMSIDPDTGLITWIPQPSQEGSHAVAVTASDRFNASTTQGFELNVLLGIENDPPRITSRPPGPAVPELPYRYQVLAQDPNGDPLTFGLDVAPLRMNIDEAGLVTWTPTVSQVGTHAVEIRVSDNRGGAVVQSFQLPVDVDALNHPPEITSEPPGPAVVGSPYEYAVTAEDLDGDPITFGLEGPPEGMVIDAATGLLAWTPQATHEGVQEFTITARDGRRGMVGQTIILDVVDSSVVDNVPPEFLSEPVGPAVVDRPYRYQVLARDPDGDPVSLRLDMPPAGMELHAATGLVTWTPTPEQVGTHNVVVVASDNRPGGEVSQVFPLNVLALPDASNHPPEITSVPRRMVHVGGRYLYQVETTDPDGDALALGLEVAPTGMATSPTGLIQWVPTNAQFGANPVRIRVDDGRGGVAVQDFTIDVVNQIIDTAPSIISTPRLTAIANRAYQYDAVAIDPEGDALFWELSAAPVGMFVDGQGTVRWNPTTDQIGTHDVALTVIDGFGGSDRQSFVVTVHAINHPPLVTSVPATEAFAGIPYVYAVQAEDPDGDPLEFRLEEAPESMMIVPANGLIQWTPAPNDVREHQVEILVEDGQGGTVRQQYTLHVLAVVHDGAPDIRSTPLQMANIGDAYSYQVVAVDPEGALVTYSFEIGEDGSPIAPGGMTIDTNSGLVEWVPTPADAGVHDVAIHATDPGGNAGMQRFNINVRRADNQPPQIHSSANNLAVVGLPYRYDFQATDPDGDSVTFRFEQAPEGMTIDDMGRVDWSPGALDVGSHIVRIIAADPFGAAARQSYALEVVEDQEDPRALIRIDPSPAPLGTTVRILVLTADDVGIDTIELTAVGEPLALDDTGAASYHADTKGIVDFVATVTDFSGNRVEVTESLLVFGPAVGAGDPPLVAITSPSDGQMITGFTLLFGVGSNQAAIEEALNNGIFPDELREAFADKDARTDKNGSEIILSDNVSVVVSELGATRWRIVDEDTGEAFNVLKEEDTLNVYSLATVRGTVSDPDGDLEFYTLSYARADSNNFIEIVNVAGSDNIASGRLGEFDTTLLPNDTYTLRLYAEDIAGNSADIAVDVSVMGELKIGNFTLSFTDLSIPVSGIPITVSRTYDTLNADQSSDFGFGWRLEFRDVDLRTSVLPLGPAFESVGLFTPFRGGQGVQNPTRVYVTLPGGRREGFTFQPEFVPINIGVAQLDRWIPAFVPDPGVTSSLTVPGGVSPGAAQEFGLFSLPAGAIDLQRNNEGEFFSLQGGIPYNPSSSFFARGFEKPKYILTTKAGIEYEVDANSGELTTVSDRNDNSLTFSDAGILSSTGKEINFERDPQGRIAAVIDPMGNRITYAYDAQGDLVAVTDREGNTTRFTYRPDPGHFLDEITDPLGQAAVQNDYDDQGRLVRLIDAAGKPVELIHNTDNFVETVEDALKRPTVFEYDTRGNIVAEIDALGNITRRTYDLNNNELTHTIILGDGTDLTTSFKYDDRGNQTSETDPLGNSSRFTYDSVNNLVTTTDPLGNSTTNTHDKRGNLRTTTDVLGNTNHFTYDTDGNLLTSTDVFGNIRAFDYDVDGNLITTTDPSSNGEGTERFTRHFTYDANGNQTSSFYVWVNPDDPADVREVRTHTFYDTTGRVVRSMGPDGKLFVVGPQFANELDSGIVSAALRDEFQLGGFELSAGSTALVEEAGSRWVVTDVDDAFFLFQRDDEISVYFDANKTVYDEVGNAIESTDVLGNRTVNIYDARGQLIQTQFPDGTITRSVYDALGRAVWTTDRYSDGSPRGPPNGTHTLYDQVGRVEGTERRQDLVINIVELADGSLASELSSVADGVISTTSTEYDAAGRVMRSTGTDGETTHFEYDLAGRQTAIILPAVPAPETGMPVHHRIEFSYDAAGRQILTRDNIAQLDPFDSSTIDRLGRRETRFEYDSLGRQTAIVSPAITDPADPSQEIHPRVETEYDEIGNRTIERKDIKQHSDGRIDYSQALETQFDYDASGRLTAVVLPAVPNPENGGVLASPRYEYEYDVYGNQRLIRDAKGRETLFTFDEQSRQRSQQLPLGQTEFQEYDRFGRLHRQIDFKGQVIEFRYDLLGRQDEKSLFTSARDADAGNPQTVIRFTYDELGRQDTIDDTRRGVVDFEYDLDGNVTQIDSPEGVINYRYDLTTGRQTGVFTVYTEVQYGYDALGRLETVAAHKLNGDVLADPLVTTYTYHLVGTRRSVELPNGVITSYEYDDLDRLTTLINAGPGDQLLSSYEYTLAFDGQREAVLETRLEDDGFHSQRQVDWDYDNLDRLIRETSFDLTPQVAGGRPELDYTADYIYDLVGNRLEKTTTIASGTESITYIYNDNDQLRDTFSSTGTVNHYDYDANGSLVTKLVDGKLAAQYTYNLENRFEWARLITTNSNGQDVETTATYIYDENGIRVRAETAINLDRSAPTLTVSVFLADSFNPTGFSQVVEQRNADKSQEITYILGDDVVTQIKITQSVPEVRYFVYDGQGSTRILVNESGITTDRFDYDAYGAAINFDAASANTNLLYSSEQFDARVQQYYLRARYYDQATGRFNRIDPFVARDIDPGHLHTYAYARLDPINLRDPSGLISLPELSVAIKVATIIGAISGVASVGTTFLGGERDPGKLFLSFATGFGTGFITTLLTPKVGPVAASTIASAGVEAIVQLLSGDLFGGETKSFKALLAITLAGAGGILGGFAGSKIPGANLAVLEDAVTRLGLLETVKKLNGELLKSASSGFILGFITGALRIYDKAVEASEKRAGEISEDRKDEIRKIFK